MPAQRAQEHATDGRRDRGSHREHQANEVHDARRALTGELVAHDRSRDRHPRGDPDALERSPYQEPGDRGRNDGDDTAQDIDREEAEGDGPPTKGVRERPADKLGKGKAKQIDRQGHLDRRRCGLQHLDEGGHRRCVKRHADGPEGHDEGPDHGGAGLGHEGLHSGPLPGSVPAMFARIRVSRVRSISASLGSKSRRAPSWTFRVIPRTCSSVGCASGASWTILARRSVGSGSRATRPRPSNLSRKADKRHGLDIHLSRKCCLAGGWGKADIGQGAGFAGRQAQTSTLEGPIDPEAQKPCSVDQEEADGLVGRISKHALLSRSLANSGRLPLHKPDLRRRYGEGTGTPRWPRSRFCLVGMRYRRTSPKYS